MKGKLLLLFLAFSFAFLASIQAKRTRTELIETTSLFNILDCWKYWKLKIDSHPPQNIVKKIVW